MVKIEDAAFQSRITITAIIKPTTERLMLKVGQRPLCLSRNEWQASGLPHDKANEMHTTDVLIIGGGIVGLRTLLRSPIACR